MSILDTALETQGGADARPDPGPQQEQNAPSPAQEQLDPEAIELQAARAAVEAEAQGTPGASAPAQEQQQPAAPAAPPSTQQAPARKPIPPVPYERFKPVVDENRVLKEEVAYLKGANEALRDRPAPQPAGDAAPGNTQQQPTTPPANTPEAMIAAAEADAMRAAEKFDTGEITAVELSRVQTAASKAIANASVQIAMQSQPAARESESVTDQMVMEQHVTQLEAAHPVIRSMTDKQLSFLSDTAHREAEAAGTPYRAGSRDTMRLREHVARLATTFAPHWNLTVPAAARPAASPATPPKPGTPGLSPSAQARLGKMDLAAGLPPDTARMGATGQMDTISEASLDTMSDDDIAALPAATRARLLT